MTESPEYQVLSVRINSALRSRLEQLRDFMARKTREKVSTSDVAKQLLESARSDYWELIEFLKQPTQALFQIRKKYEAQHPLSRAEWGVLVHYVQIGQEALSLNPLSLGSQRAILEAFQAIYPLRKGTSDRDDYYIGNLPCRPDDSNDPSTPEQVHKAIAATLQAFANGDEKASFAGRNLQIFLEEEKIPAVDALNKALRPYWLALWRVAARGHYLEQRQPIRDPHRDREESEDNFAPDFPPVEEDG